MVTPLASLIRSLKKFPGVGEKTATRYAFHILNAKREEIEELVRAINLVKDKLRLCSKCFNPTDTDPCAICRDTRRDDSKICVVETPIDLVAIERSGIYRGLYHILHGTLSPLDGVGPKDIRLMELLERSRKEQPSEIILALNPSIEGEATASYIAAKLKELGVKVSKIAYGVPIGGVLEYVDPLTLERALDNRKEF
ncbi:MAG: recombination mediator RecR [Desulfomonilaceae bacterium]